MVDSLSKDAMEIFGYKCFGKASANNSSSPEDLTDLTNFPSKIYFSTLNNLLFIFRKEGCKDFKLYLTDSQPTLQFEGCELVKGLRKMDLEESEDFLVNSTDLRLNPNLYLHFKEEFTTEEILDIINNPKEVYFDYDYNLITKEEYYNILNQKGFNVRAYKN